MTARMSSVESFVFLNWRGGRRARARHTHTHTRVTTPPPRNGLFALTRAARLQSPGSRARGGERTTWWLCVSGAWPGNVGLAMERGARGSEKKKQQRAPREPAALDAGEQQRRARICLPLTLPNPPFSSQSNNHGPRCWSHGRRRPRPGAGCCAKPARLASGSLREWSSWEAGPVRVPHAQGRGRAGRRVLDRWVGTRTRMLTVGFGRAWGAPQPFESD
jgi:hypothetical protein